MISLLDGNYADKSDCFFQGVGCLHLSAGHRHFDGPRTDHDCQQQLAGCFCTGSALGSEKSAPRPRKVRSAR